MAKYFCDQTVCLPSLITRKLISVTKAKSSYVKVNKTIELTGSITVVSDLNRMAVVC